MKVEGTKRADKEEIEWWKTSKREMEEEKNGSGRLKEKAREKKRDGG